MDNKGKHTVIELSKLRFDPKNPRLPSRLNSASEEDILDWMLKDTGILELMQSIGEQGYFDGEPLLVVEGANEGYLVVEGNRRLAALKLLHQPSLADFKRVAVANIASEETTIKPDRIPCVIYPARKDVLDYLGFRHVTGIKSWSPLAKARYVRDLATKYDDVPEAQIYRLLARSIGSRSDYVRRMLVGLKLYEIIAEDDYYGIRGLDEASISFSLITTALANSDIVTFLGLENAQDLDQRALNREHLKQLTHWIFEKLEDGRPVIGESRRLKDLNKVVASEMALVQLRNGRSLDNALIYTSAPIESFRELLLVARHNILEAQKQFHLILEGLEDSDETVLSDIYRLTRDVRNLLRARLEESTDDSGFEE